MVLWCCCRRCCCSSSLRLCYNTLASSSQQICIWEDCLSFFRNNIMLLARITNRCFAASNKIGARRGFSFSFVGPRSLNDILKTELLADKNASEVSEIWISYHEPKVSGAVVVYDISWHESVFVLSRMSGGLIDLNLYYPWQKNVHGLILKGEEGKSVIARAKEW